MRKKRGREEESYNIAEVMSKEVILEGGYLILDVD